MLHKVKCIKLSPSRHTNEIKFYFDIFYLRIKKIVQEKKNNN